MKVAVGDLVMAKCMICQSNVQEVVDHQLDTTFFHCPVCEFVYQEPASHVNKEKEKEQYDFHENSFENEGYVNYLRTFLKTHVLPLNKTGIALDFGSGPGPVLYELMKEYFDQVYHYDPFYHPSEDFKKHTYDVVTSTEVVEHFTDPIKEFTRLKELLKDDGYLVVMTNFRTMDMDQFLHWWYRRDTTHISFYHVKTFEKIADKIGFKIVSQNEKNVIILKRA